MVREIERCRQEIAAIKAELLSGNREVEGLVLALADWSAELRILRNEGGRRNNGDSSPEGAGNGSK
jgi:hypothetical protein